MSLSLPFSVRDARALAARAALAAVPALMALPLAAPAAAATPVYQVTLLPDLGGGLTRPTRINDQGFITGQSSMHDGDRRGVAFRLAHHRMEGLPQDTRGHPTYGQDINAAGTVVGREWSGFRDGYRSWPFVWPAGGEKIPFTQPGRFEAINDAGVATGRIDVGDGHFHAVTWQDGTLVDLGTPEGTTDSAGLAINALGDIAGLAGPSVDGPPTRALLRLDGVMIDLGTLGGDSAMATGINASRQVCGQYSDATGELPHGFLLDAGTGAWQTLDEPAGTVWLSPAALNDQGVVVGHMRRQGPGGAGAVHGFVWQAGHTADLNDLLTPDDARAWVIEHADSIDNHGRIVARAHPRSGGLAVGVVLRPVR